MSPFWTKTHHLGHMVVFISVLWLCISPAVDAVDELSKDGTFAGNDAIVAVSRCCGVNVVIHQLGTAGWEVQAPGSAPGSASGSAAPVRTLHIAYLRGEHYCSVCPLQGHPLPKVVRRTSIHEVVVLPPSPLQPSLHPVASSR